MKKLFKRILLFLGALFLFIILFGVGYLVKAKGCNQKNDTG